MAINGSGALGGAASGAATGAEFGFPGIAIGGLVGGLAGAFSGGDDNSWQYTAAANAAAGQGQVALNDARAYMDPFYQSGLGSLSFLDYMNTGVKPAWGDTQQSELDNLLSSGGYSGANPRLAKKLEGMSLEEQKQWLEGELSTAGTSRDRRHVAEVYGPALREVQSQLDKISKLKQQQQAYQALQNPELASALGNDGSQYIDQLKNLNIPPSLEQLQNDPIYQWQQKQIADTINRQQAFAGGLNSRDTYNIQTDATMGLASREADKLYGRQYNSILDQFNITNNLYGQRYGRLADNVNRAAGIATNYGQMAVNTGQNTSNATQSAMYQDAAYKQSQPSTFQNLLGAAQQGIGNYQDWKFQNKYLAPYFESMINANNNGVQVQPISGGLGNFTPSLNTKNFSLNY